jgi:radical SAM superfamily enzyme YgiQ (UPF0313 family)
MWTRKWNVRSPGNVVAEMKKYIEQYQVTNFDFYDLTAIVRKEWIVEFCDLLIKEKLNITWQLPSGTRSEAINEEVSKKLYESGCRLMNYAPESGSPTELKRIKKQVKLENMIRSMRASIRNKIQVKCNFIFGMPGASWSDVVETWQFIAQIAFIGVQDISAFPFSPYPGTELFKMLEKEGKVRLSDQYFKKLAAFTDFLNGNSFNDRFSSRTLSVICSLTMLYFYALSCLFRPIRFFKMIYYWIIKDTSWRFNFALSHVKKRMVAKKLLEEQMAQTVVIEPSFLPLQKRYN